jgi:hypothetical protein
LLWVCGWRRHADHNAAITLGASRGDREVEATKTRQERLALLAARHKRWRADTGWS